MQVIPHNRPFLDQREIQASERVLRSHWLVQGREVKTLEQRMRKLIGVRYAVAVNSGASALHLSLLALGVNKNHEVILPTYSCSALLNAVFYTGALPILVDVEKNGFNIDPGQVKKKITPKTKAIIVPHTFGFSARIHDIMQLGIPVVEDCAQSLGSSYRGKALGSFGDISIFSFYASKMIAAGQGGMLVTNTQGYFNAVSDLIDYDKRLDYKVRYNYQLTDLAAAIARVQLSKLQAFIKRRRYIASRYIAVLRKKGISYWPRENDAESNHFRFLLQFSTQLKRNQAQKRLAKYGISTIIPIAPYQLLHRYLELDRQNFPHAERLSKTALSLPIFPGLTDLQIDHITSSLDVVLL